MYLPPNLISYSITDTSGANFISYSIKKIARCARLVCFLKIFAICTNINQSVKLRNTRGFLFSFVFKNCYCCLKFFKWLWKSFNKPFEKLRLFKNTKFSIFIYSRLSLYILSKCVSMCLWRLAFTSLRS